MIARCWLLLVLLLPLCCGCQDPPAPAPPLADETPALRVMVVDDPALGAAIQREWLAYTESSVEIVDVSASQAAQAQQLPVDVVIYAPEFLGQFAATDLLLPLDEGTLSAPAYDRDDVLPLLRSQETTWGRKILAAPLGSPQFVLFYRADLLKSQNLQPPRTWPEYSKLVAKFAEKPAGVSEEVQNWQATAEPLAPGWGARLLLARAASSALHRDQLSPLWNLESLEPLVTSPPWVRALEALQADNRLSKTEPKLPTPVDCYAQFLAGECAFAITWPLALPDAAAAAATLSSEQIGMALLPGSTDVFNPLTGKWEDIGADESLQVPLLGVSGRVASVTRASAQPRMANRLVAWLSGPGMSGRIAPLSSATTVFRQTHFENEGTWQAAPELKKQLVTYGNLLNSVQSAPRRFSVPRIPGEHDYLASLDAAVLSAVRQEQTAEESLRTAAAKWQEVTKARGVTTQQRELRRSLGLSD